MRTVLSDKNPACSFRYAGGSGGTTECCKTTRLSEPIDIRAVPSALNRTLPASVEWPPADTDLAPWFWHGYLLAAHSRGARTLHSIRVDPCWAHVLHVRRCVLRQALHV